MDEFVDELLQSEHSCDTILPRLTKRYILEDQGLLEPRISPLEEDLLDDWADEQVEPIVDEVPQEIIVVDDQDDDFIPPDKIIPLEDIDPLNGTKKKKFSKKKIKGLFKKETAKPKPKPVEGQEEGEEEEKPKSGFKDGSLTFHESNILRANLGLAPLRPPVGTNMPPKKN